MNIKPIETEYNGYRFRSRLEARWAVFFDAAGIAYEYEPEGFEVKYEGAESIRYLPDFYLPDFDIYAEVKGSDEQLAADSERIGWCVDFDGTPLSEKGLLILGPIPYKEGHLPVFDYLFWDKGVVAIKATFLTDSGRAEFVKDGDSTWDFIEDPSVPLYSGIYRGNRSVCSTASVPDGVSTKAVYFNAYNMIARIHNDLADTNRCYIRARQARFEHGEKPNTGR